MQEEKHIAIGILGGAIIGCILGVILALLTLQNPDDQSQATLDYLIDRWILDRESMLLSGIPARKELPDARPAYFPPIVRQLAKQLDTLYNIPEGVTLAQWVIESSWGRNNLGVSNYFGHTFPAVRRFLTDTIPVMRRERMMRDGIIVPGDSVLFASYRDIRECFDVHGKYISGSTRFGSAFQTRSAEKFAVVMGRQYATDPDYGLKLIIIMRRYKL
jgi:hypothetical protein